MHAILEKFICNSLNTFILFELMHRMYYTLFTRKIWLNLYKKLVMHVEVGRSNNRSCFQRRLRLMKLTKTHRRISILDKKSIMFHNFVVRNTLRGRCFLRILRLLKPTKTHCRIIILDPKKKSIILHNFVVWNTLRGRWFLRRLRLLEPTKTHCRIIILDPKKKKYVVSQLCSVKHPKRSLVPEETLTIKVH